MAQPKSTSAPRADDYQFGVLIVDDDETILNLLKEIITMVPGCHVRTATEPAIAMKEIVRNNIDIVITDVHMPGVTGLEMLKDIVALERTPEIIVMTAYPSGEIANQAMELGAMSMIAKPFDDIAQVEAELEKAIKKILRQRSTEKEVAAKKRELASLQTSAPDTDEVMKVSLPDSPVEDPRKNGPKPAEQGAPASTSVSAPSEAPPVKEPLDYGVMPTRKLYPISLLEPLIEIEMERCKRYKRQMAIGMIDIPEPSPSADQIERQTHRQEQIELLENCVRKSDVILDAGADGVAVLAYECNRLGVEVVEHKLMASGFQHTGFGVYPSEAKNPGDVIEVAKRNLQGKRKFQILVLEQEEFFARILLNMLSDPKYFPTWSKSFEDAYQMIIRMTEKLKLLTLSMTKDPKQWALLARLKKENLVQWPILLFIDVPLTPPLRDQLRTFGVRAVINRAISQEEFTYIVQTLVLPKPIQEERKNFRALVTLPVQYEFEGKKLSSNTFTLSRDGLFIRDMNPPQSGTRMQLEIFMPGQTGSLKTTAEVLYAVPYFVGVNRFHVAGAAVKFLDFTEEQKNLIDTFVSQSRTSYFL